MQRNLSHIISQATSAPLLLEPAYARVFFCALGRESGINSLHIPGNNESLDQSDMALVTGDFMATGKPQARFYQVVNGIAVLPVTGTLVHKLGGMRPFYGTKSTNTTGNHTHQFGGYINSYWGDSNHTSFQPGGGAWTQAAGDHAHTVYIGGHEHTMYIGPHGHVVIVDADGNAETTVKNIAFNYIVRLA
ncbi:hypothetical protein CL319_21530 [Salmonella enterica]|nr:hypothetical protein [Salmonella enterica]